MTWKQRLREAYDTLCDRFVDPRDAWLDDSGARWLPLAEGDSAGGASSLPLGEHELRAVRSACRALAVTNEFAINGHENRISYLVGTGHTYRAVARKFCCPNQPLVAAVQEVIDQFTRVNQWARRQQEIVLRQDRDGEVFLRYFADHQGTLRVRFVEPGQVVTPPEHANRPEASFGIETDPHDVETPRRYWIDGRPIEADEIQHRKAQVDANVKRGLPLFYPVMKNLRRAEKLLRNMSVVSEIQSAIALIRKHRGGTRTAVQQFVAAQADGATPGPAGRAMPWKHYPPGTILDAPGEVDYDFPAAGLDAARYVTVLQAELRAIASRLVMPEFMLTSDASNANYASTLVAEGPAVKMFERLQSRLMEDDLEVLRRAVRAAVAAGRLPAAALTEVDVTAAAPSLAARDHKQEAETRQILHAAGILSAQTWSQLAGLDYDQEQHNRRLHNDLKNVQK